MEFKTMVEKVLEVKKAYNVLNTQRGEKQRDVNSYVQGFSCDVGNLSRLVMAKTGFRTVENVDNKLQEEMIDCLRSIIAIADELGIDLETEFPKRIKELEDRVNEVNGPYKENS